MKLLVNKLCAINLEFIKISSYFFVEEYAFMVKYIHKKVYVLLCRN